MEEIQRPVLADLHRYQPSIRFSDIDAMGIVNNAVFLTYFEESRVHFFSRLIEAKWDWNSAGVVVARHEISYRNPIRYLANVEIFTWAARLGGKSLDMAYEVWVRTRAVVVALCWPQKRARRWWPTTTSQASRAPSPRNGFAPWRRSAWADRCSRMTAADLRFCTS